MNHYDILYPALALIAWTFAMGGVMLRTAFRAIGEGLSIEYFRFGSGDNPPAYMRSAYQHFTNLFETPVLFYTVLLLTFVTAQGAAWMIALAWIYVGARVVHSIIHLKNTNLPRRRDSFLLSLTVLIAMWAGLLIQLVTA